MINNEYKFITRKISLLFTPYLVINYERLLLNIQRYHFADVK